jgi:peptide/nickel transport system permease protein
LAEAATAKVDGPRRHRSWLLRIPWFSSGILSVVIFLGIVGPLIVPHDPIESNLMESFAPPFQAATYPLGTDNMGRDVLSRIVGGARISLIVGITVVFVAGALGTIFAMMAGFFGGWLDSIIMRVTDTFLSLPYLMVAIVMTAVLGPSVRNIIVVLVVIGWAGYARVIRAEVLKMKQADFIRLAITAGASRWKILIRHIFPNVVNTLIVLATLQLGTTIIAEASLSFLGMGVPPPHPSWGLMLAQGRDYITYAWWLCVWPGLAIMLTVLSCNLLGDWLRVRLDPKFRQL